MTTVSFLVTVNWSRRHQTQAQRTAQDRHFCAGGRQWERGEAQYFFRYLALFASFHLIMSTLAAARADNMYYPPEWRPEMGGISKFQGSKGANQYEQYGKIRFELPVHGWCLGCGRHIGRVSFRDGQYFKLLAGEVPRHPFPPTRLCCICSVLDNLYFYKTTCFLYWTPP